MTKHAEVSMHIYERFDTCHSHAYNVHGSSRQKKKGTKPSKHAPKRGFWPTSMWVLTLNYTVCCPSHQISGTADADAPACGSAESDPPPRLTALNPHPANTNLISHTTT